jgi:hypothetical protein
MVDLAIQGGIILALGAALVALLLTRRALREPLWQPGEIVPEAPLLEPELVSDPAWSAPLLFVVATEPEPAPEEEHLPEPVPAPLALVPAEPVVVASWELADFETPREPATALETELAAVDAVDPFSTFWLDAEAPMPAGLTAGYLPPLTGMWSTPTGETL